MKNRNKLLMCHEQHYQPFIMKSLIAKTEYTTALYIPSFLLQKLIYAS